MTIRENIAINLRRLCAERASINAVCRDIGINRQQFERYLTGQAIPGQRTLKKICLYFGIAEEELFSDPDADGRAMRTIGVAPSAVTDEVLAALQPVLAGPPASIRPGIYLLWLTIPKMPGRLICTVMILRRDGEMMTFRRLTGMGEARRSNWKRYRGDHQGVVAERIGQYFFVAINQRGITEPSFLRLNWVPLSDATLSGIGLVITPAGASIVSAIMRPVPAGMTLKQALRTSRVYQKSELEEDDLLLHLMDEQSRATVNTLMSDYGLLT